MRAMSLGLWGSQICARWLAVARRVFCSCRSIIAYSLNLDRRAFQRKIAGSGDIRRADPIAYLAADPVVHRVGQPRPGVFGADKDAIPRRSETGSGKRQIAPDAIVIAPELPGRRGSQVRRELPTRFGRISSERDG